MSKSLVATEKPLDSLLANPLLELGFERAQRLIYRRKITEPGQFLRFPTRLENNVAFFGANAAIRFAKIEELLGNSDPLSATLMMPLHLLRPGRKFLEWKFSPETSGRLIDEVLTDCRQYLLPFFDTMSGLETLKSQLIYEIDHYAKKTAQRARLNSEEERNKFDSSYRDDGKLKLVLGPEQRVVTLAAIHVLEGRKDAAEHLIDSETAKLMGTNLLPPQIACRSRWERLKKTLLC